MQAKRELEEQLAKLPVIEQADFSDAEEQYQYNSDRLPGPPVLTAEGADDSSEEILDGSTDEAEVEECPKPSFVVFSTLPSKNNSSINSSQSSLPGVFSHSRSQSRSPDMFSEDSEEPDSNAKGSEPLQEDQAGDVEGSEPVKEGQADVKGSEPIKEGQAGDVEGSEPSFLLHSTLPGMKPSSLNSSQSSYSRSRSCSPDMFSEPPQEEQAAGTVEGPEPPLEEQACAVEGSESDQEEQAGTVEGSESDQEEQAGAGEGSESDQEEQEGAGEGSESDREEQAGAVEGTKSHQEEQAGAVEGSESHQEEQAGAVEGSESHQEEQAGAVDGSESDQEEQEANDEELAIKYPPGTFLVVVYKKKWLVGRVIEKNEPESGVEDWGAEYLHVDFMLKTKKNRLKWPGQPDIINCLEVCRSSEC